MNTWPLFRRSGDNSVKELMNAGNTFFLLKFDRSRLKNDLKKIAPETIGNYCSNNFRVYVYVCTINKSLHYYYSELAHQRTTDQVSGYDVTRISASRSSYPTCVMTEDSREVVQLDQGGFRRKNDQYVVYHDQQLASGEAVLIRQEGISTTTVDGLKFVQMEEGSLHGLAPPYLADDCILASSVAGRSQLRSAANFDLVWHGKSGGSRLRTFAVSGPKTWNSLPVELRSPELSIESFRKKLKHYLFTLN